ncbi:hypothetical protein [Mycoplasma capricolum]|uniref:hypothetical protein n=1 Tax=Mycoplasma capricolum TaxID=2095 RepID=UPI003DA28F7E
MRTKAIYPQRLRKIKFYIWKSLSLIDTLYIGLCIGLGFVLYKTLTIIPKYQNRVIPAILVPALLLILIIPSNFKKPEIKIYHQIQWFISFLIIPKIFNRQSKVTKNKFVKKVEKTKKDEQDLATEVKKLNQIVKKQSKVVKKTLRKKVFRISHKKSKRLNLEQQSDLDLIKEIKDLEQLFNKQSQNEKRKNKICKK